MTRETWALLEHERRSRLGLDPPPRRWPSRVAVLGWLAGILALVALTCEFRW